MFPEHRQHQAQHQEFDDNPCGTLEQPQGQQAFQGNLEQHGQPEGVQQQADGHLDQKNRQEDLPFPVPLRKHQP